MPAIYLPQPAPSPGQAAIRLVGGVPNVAQNQWPGQPTDNQNQDRTLSLPFATLPNSLILNLGTLSNGGGTPLAPIYSDDVNNAWGTGRKLQQIDDVGGQQSIFLHAYQNSVGGVQTMSVHWDNLEWQGLYVVEVVNVRAGALVSNKNTQDSHTGTTADSIVSGTVTGDGGSYLALGFCEVMMDASVANGGSGLGRPDAGTAWPSIDQVWNWNGEENTSLAPIVQFEGKIMTVGATPVQATFTPTGPDNYCSIVVIVPSN